MLVTLFSAPLLSCLPPTPPLHLRHRRYPAVHIHFVLLFVFLIVFETRRRFPMVHTLQSLSLLATVVAAHVPLRSGISTLCFIVLRAPSSSILLSFFCRLTSFDFPFSGTLVGQITFVRVGCRSCFFVYRLNPPLP